MSLGFTVDILGEIDFADFNGRLPWTTESILY